MAASVGSWSVADVCDWLSSLGLQAHAPAFASSAIDGELLLQLSTEELVELGVLVPLA